MSEVIARRAAVRPRVFVIGKPSTDPHLLEDVVRETLQTQFEGMIEIVGTAGMGKTTALQHLVEVLTPAERFNLRFYDDPDWEQMIDRPPGEVHICTRTKYTHPTKAILTVQLSEWLEDDAIEYLLTKHHDQCGSVMSRLSGSEENRIEYALLLGCPETIALVLDRMAQDENLTSVKQSVRNVLWEHFSDGELRVLSGELCLYSLLGLDQRQHKTWKKLEKKTTWKQLNEQHQQLPRKLLRHTYVQTLLAAEEVVREIANNEQCHFRMPRKQPRLAFEAARLIEPDSPAEQNLKRILGGRKHRGLHPLAASLLHMTERGWRPGRKPIPDLRGAVLHGIQLVEENLCSFDLSEAVLCDANLSHARLVRAQLVETNLIDANLSNAGLSNAVADRAKLRRACLKNITAPESSWNNADLSSAVLEAAQLDNARFREANLSQADFTNASLRGASFSDARIDGTIFAGADLTSARLPGLELDRCDLTGACFDSAHLSGSYFEGVNLPEANFENANLTNTYWTESVLACANFKGAVLRQAGLAGIEWEHADLRGADLRECTFHMGSSRSGLVDSFLASEGTRTGFYTDEYEEQHYKSPEEIRKANLRGADLRGANILGVDFYLVDLRDARFDDDQRQQLEKTGAILFDRG